MILPTIILPQNFNFQQHNKPRLIKKLPQNDFQQNNEIHPLIILPTIILPVIILPVIILQIIILQKIILPIIILPIKNYY